MSFLGLYPVLKKAPLTRRLLAGRPTVLRDPDALPRQIYLYWDQGLDTAPEIVRLCIDSWTRMNPGWTVTVLDRAAADRVVPFATLPPDIRLPHYANLLRLTLLLRNGGVWADATVWCNRPLDDWLPIVMTQTGFFAFHRPGPDRMLSSWFLAAVPEDPLAASWLDISWRFWRNRRRGSRVYHWFHYLFEYRWLTSAAMRRAWEAVPSVGAAGPHALQGLMKSGAAPSPAEMAVIRVAPMHKLTFRWGVPAAAVAAMIDRCRGVEARPRLVSAPPPAAETGAG